MPAYSRILLPWDSQPQEVVEANLSLLAPAALFNFAEGAQPINGGLRARGLSWTWSGTSPSLKPNSSGIGLFNGAPATTFHRYGGTRSFDGFSPASSPAWFAWSMSGGTYVNNGSSVNIAWSYGNLDSAAGFYASVTSANVLNVRLANTLIVGPTIVAGAVYNCCAGRNASGDCWLWINGALYASGTSATAADSASASSLHVLSDGGGSRCYNGTLNVLAFGSENPSGFGASLSGNPWQIFAPRSIWVPVSQAAAPGAFQAAWAHRRTRTIGAGVI